MKKNKRVNTKKRWQRRTSDDIFWLVCAGNDMGDRRYDKEIRGIGRGGRDVTNDEIFARIASNVADVGNSMFGVRGITIWMTNDLFNRLLPEQLFIHNGSAMITLFGCRIRVVISPCDGMRWIVGYEGKIEEGE